MKFIRNIKANLDQIDIKMTKLCGQVDQSVSHRKQYLQSFILLDMNFKELLKLGPQKDIE